MQRVSLRAFSYLSDLRCVMFLFGTVLLSALLNFYLSLRPPTTPQVGHEHLTLRVQVFHVFFRACGNDS